MTTDNKSALLRGVQVLLGLVETGRPVTVTQLARSLELPSSTTHRILSLLRDHGYATQAGEGGAYALGPAFLRATDLYRPASTSHRVIEAALRRLVRDSGESAFFGAYLGELGRLRFVATIQSHHAIQYVLRKDLTYSLLLGASGLAVAAALPERELRAIYERDRPSREGVVEPAAWPEFRLGLERIRQQGFAVTDGQRAEGAHSVAAPVLRPEGSVIGCIGISMPSMRQDDSKTRRLVELVTQASSELTVSTEFFQPDVPVVDAFFG